MAKLIDNLIDKKESKISKYRRKVKEALESIRIQIESRNESKRPQSYNQFSVSTMEELKSNSQLLADIKKHDSKIYPLIESCLKNDIRTYASCQGHLEEKDRLGYIGFDEPQSAKVKDIISYVVQNKMNDQIGFSNFGITSYFQCCIYWPVEETEQRVREIIDVINNKVVVNNSKVPEMISLMEKLTHICAENSISISIGRQGGVNNISSGYINLMMYGKNSAKPNNEFNNIVNILDDSGFEKTVFNYYYEFEWDEKIGDKNICKTITKVMDTLKKNKE